MFTTVEISTHDIYFLLHFYARKLKCINYMIELINAVHTKTKTSDASKLHDFKNYINSYISGHISDPSSGLTNKNLNKIQ